MMVRENQIRRRAFSLTDLRDNRSAMVSAGSGINPAHQFPIEERHEDDGCFCANTTPTSNLPKMNEDELHMDSAHCSGNFLRDDPLFRRPLRKINRLGVQRPKHLFYKKGFLRRSAKFDVKASPLTRRRKFGKCHHTAIYGSKLMDFFGVSHRQRVDLSRINSPNYFLIDGKLPIFGDNRLVDLSQFSNFSTFPRMLNHHFHHSTDFDFISRITGGTGNAMLDFLATRLPALSSSNVSSPDSFSTFQDRSSSKNNHQICQKSLILKNDRVVHDTFDGLLTSATVQVFDRAFSSITLTPIPPSIPKINSGSTATIGSCDCHPKTNMFGNNSSGENVVAINGVVGDDGGIPSSSSQFFNSVVHQFNELAIDVNSVPGENNVCLSSMTVSDGPPLKQLCSSDLQQEDICRQLAGLPLSDGDVNSGGAELPGTVPPPTSPSYASSSSNGKPPSTAFFSDATAVDNNSTSFGSVFGAPAATLPSASMADASAAFEMSCLKI